jgi:hypothetical protein
MKRKLILMGFAVLAGLPHAVLAKSNDKENATQSQIAWVGARMPHYGSESAAPPLMEHLAVMPSGRQAAVPNTWRLDFAMPRTEVAGLPDPLPARGGRAGVSLKLDF